MPDTSDAWVWGGEEGEGQEATAAEQDAWDADDDGGGAAGGWHAGSAGAAHVDGGAPALGGGSDSEWGWAM